MFFTRPGSRASTSVSALCLAIALTACSTVIGRRAGEDEWALRGEEAFRQGRFAAAEHYWRNALQSAQRLGRHADAAGFRVNLAGLDEARGNYAVAERAAAEVAEYGQLSGYEALQARALNVVALAQRRLGGYARSLGTAREAHRIARKLGIPTLEAESLKHIGAAYQAKGGLDQAYDAYTKGLAIARAAGDPVTEAQLSNDLGGLYRFRAEYQQAKEAYERASKLHRQQDNLRGEGKVLGNLCILYQNLGDLHRALDYCETSLDLARASGDRSLQANNLNNLGGLHRSLGDHQQALDAYHRSLGIKRRLRDRAGEARALANLGDLHRRQGDIAMAIEYLRQSLRIGESIDDRSGQSAGHYNLGWVHLHAHRYEDACAEFGRALGLQSTIGQPELVWRSFDGLSRCWDARSNQALAIFFGKQAVNTIQRVRANIHTMEPEAQRNFLRDKADVYRRLADLLIDQGRLLEAQQVMAMLKEEEYFDFVRRGEEDDQRSTVLASNTLEAKELARYNGIARKLVEIGQEYAALQEKVNPSQADEARLALLQTHLDDALETHNKLLVELESEFTKIGRGVEFGEKDLRTLGALAGQMKELGHRVLLAHYLVLDDRVRIIVTLPDPAVPPLHRDVALTRADLNRLIHAARIKLGNRGSDPRPELKELYARLIAPIDGDLAAYAPEVLMLSLDQALRYVPYSALYDGAHYLVERYSMAMYNLATKGFLNEPAEEWRAVGFGVSKAVGTFPPLPAVRDELDAIVIEGGTDRRGALPGKTYVDEAFTEKQFRDVLRRGGYSLIHLASHFHFEPGGTYDQSYLLLGGGEHLTLQQLKDRGYQLHGVDLLTFSACDTAVGNEGDPGAGAEVESFGKLAQDKGARAVLATLWKIADLSTAHFMASFYRRREQKQEIKAEALRQTQIAFIRAESGGQRAPDEGKRGQVLEHSSGGAETSPPVGASYAHPYYWAPFVLMGNWL